MCTDSADYSEWKQEDATGLIHFQPSSMSQKIWMDHPEVLRQDLHWHYYGFKQILNKLRLQTESNSYLVCGASNCDFSTIYRVLPTNRKKLQIIEQRLNSKRNLK
jgi:hypothetical protein